MSTQDLKALFRKIALNPDAQVDWSEVGYCVCKIGTTALYRFKIPFTIESLGPVDSLIKEIAMIK